MTEPVTVIVRRRVKPGSEAFYEDWLARLTQAASEMPGYEGANFVRPSGAGEPYTSVFRYRDLATLEAFERSELRARFLREVQPHVLADAVWDKTTGLEVWFQAPKGTQVAQPSPHRMALLLVAVVFGLVMLLNGLLAPWVEGWPPALRVLLTVVLQVLLMTYLIMPRLTRLLARWIFPSSKTAL